MLTGMHDLCNLKHKGIVRGGFVAYPPPSSYELKILPHVVLKFTIAHVLFEEENKLILQDDKARFQGKIIFQFMILIFLSIHYC